MHQCQSSNTAKNTDACWTAASNYNMSANTDTTDCELQWGTWYTLDGVTWNFIQNQNVVQYNYQPQQNEFWEQAAYQYCQTPVITAPPLPPSAIEPPPPPPPPLTPKATAPVPQNLRTLTYVTNTETTNTNQNIYEDPSVKIIETQKDTNYQKQVTEFLDKIQIKNTNKTADLSEKRNDINTKEMTSDKKAKKVKKHKKEVKKRTKKPNMNVKKIQKELTLINKEIIKRQLDLEIKEKQIKQEMQLVKRTEKRHGDLESTIKRLDTVKDDIIMKTQKQQIKSVVKIPEKNTSLKSDLRAHKQKYLIIRNKPSYNKMTENNYIESSNTKKHPHTNNIDIKKQAPKRKLEDNEVVITIKKSKNGNDMSSTNTNNEQNLNLTIKFITERSNNQDFVESNTDLSFLDDINIEEIVECLNSAHNKENADGEKQNADNNISSEYYSFNNIDKHSDYDELLEISKMLQNSSTNCTSKEITPTVDISSVKNEDDVIFVNETTAAIIKDNIINLDNDDEIQYCNSNISNTPNSILSSTQLDSKNSIQTNKSNETSSDISEEELSIRVKNLLLTIMNNVVKEKNNPNLVENANASKQQMFIPLENNTSSTVEVSNPEHHEIINMEKKQIEVGFNNNKKLNVSALEENNKKCELDNECLVKAIKVPKDECKLTETIDNKNNSYFQFTKEKEAVHNMISERSNITEFSNSIKNKDTICNDSRNNETIWESIKHIKTRIETENPVIDNKPEINPTTEFYSDNQEIVSEFSHIINNEEEISDDNGNNETICIYMKDIKTHIQTANTVEDNKHEINVTKELYLDSQEIEQEHTKVKEDQNGELYKVNSNNTSVKDNLEDQEYVTVENEKPSKDTLKPISKNKPDDQEDVDNINQELNNNIEIASKNLNSTKLAISENLLTKDVNTEHVKTDDTIPEDKNNINTELNTELQSTKTDNKLKPVALEQKSCQKEETAINHDIKLKTYQEVKKPQFVKLYNYPENLNFIRKMEHLVSIAMRGKFNVSALINKGNSSNIFQCVNRKRGESVAIKVLKMEYAGCQERSVAIQEILQKVQRSVPSYKYHCAYLINCLSIEGRWGFIFEYLPYNLEQVLVDNYFHINKLRNLAKQLVSAILVLRNNSIVHSDIKPKHILMNYHRTQLKLCGFDEASEVLGVPFISNVGTLQYRAPEIILGYSMGYSIDVWSTAVVLYEMATNRKLFTASTNNEMLYQQMSLVGNAPWDMVQKSMFKNAHYKNGAFFRRHFNVTDSFGTVRTRTQFIKKFRDSTHLSTSIWKHYNWKWANTRSQEKFQEDLAKLDMFIRLLQRMLVISPHSRLAIEFVYTDPFLF